MPYPTTSFAGLLFFTFLMLASTPASAQSQTLAAEKITIVTSRGNYDFQVEIADQPEEQTIGLMNRTELDARGGMLFVFGKARLITMWMKNTFISLDMLFVSNEGIVKSVAQNTTPHSLDTISSTEPVSYVLELNGGMAALIGLKPGDKLIHPLFK